MKTIIIILSVTMIACGVQSGIPVLIPEPVFTVTANTYTATVISDALNVRECAGTSCKILSQLEKGSIVTVSESKEVDDKLCSNWSRIYNGWVCSRFIH